MMKLYLYLVCEKVSYSIIDFRSVSLALFTQMAGLYVNLWWLRSTPPLSMIEEHFKYFGIPVAFHWFY